MGWSVGKLLTTTKYFVKSYMYSKKFYVSLLVPLAVLLLASVADIAYNVHKTVNGYLSSAVSIFVVLFYPVIFALLAGDLIAEDFEKRKAYFIFTLPLQRGLIYISKVAASILVAFTIISIYNMTTLLFALAYYKSIVARFIQSYALQIVYAIAWISLSAVVGSFCRSSRTAIITAILVNFFVLNTLGSIIAKAGIEQVWFILNYAYYPIYTILLSKSPSTMTITTSIGAVTIQVPTMEHMLLVSAMYILVCLAIGYFIYTRREVA